MSTKALATQTQRLMRLGYCLNWDFVYLGKAPVPAAPVRAGEWLIVPACEDTSPIPRQTLRRIQTIYREGFRPQSWVLVHEAPRQLCAPRQNKPAHLLPYLALLGGLGIWLASTVMVTAVMVDPILIAVMPGLDWIEVDRWYG